MSYSTLAKSAPCISYSFPVNFSRAGSADDDESRVEYDIAVSNFYKSNSGSNGSLRVTYRDVATDTRYVKIYPLRVDTVSRTLFFTGSESFNSETEIERLVLNATGATDTINNNATVDLFTVSSGETRKVQLSATSSELIENADSSFYTMNTAIDNNTYFGGMKLFYFGARFFDPELGVFVSTDPIADSMPRFPSLSKRLPPGVRLAALVGAEEAARIMGDIEASGYDPRVIEEWKQKLLSNPYNYCFNNPMNFIDPDGRWGLAHFFQTFFQEFTHQVALALSEIGEGLINVLEGSITFNFEKFGKGFGSVFEGIGGTLWAPIEATGTAAYSVMPDIENYAYGEHSHTKLAKFLRWAGVGSGGSRGGSHGGSDSMDIYTASYKNDVHSKNPFKRWRAKGHLAHTAQDAHIHRNDWWMTGKREDVLEGLDWNPHIWIPAIFTTNGDYERTVYGY
ncbi:MAG TPA: hypothetical protein VHO70_11395 [Chitinispirillaceae bacterium]|nr:hypothetical protein [Chitinispirillaceae bacterium]